MIGKMTHKDRLMAAIRHQAVDKVPCSPRIGQALNIIYNDYKTDLTDLIFKAAASEEIDLDPHFFASSGVSCVINRTDGETLGLKDVKIDVSSVEEGTCNLFTRVIATPAGRLKEIIRKPKPGAKEYGIGPDPQPIEHLIKGPEDLVALRYLMPNPDNHEVGTHYHEIVKKVGDLGIVMAFLRGPLDYQGGYVYGLENLMVDYYERRDFFNDFLKIWYDKMMAETRAILEKGAKMVFTSWFYHSLSSGWSPAIFRDAFFPLIKNHVALVHSYGAIYDYYDDGKCMGIMDMIKEAKVDVFETLTPPPVGDADLKELKKRIGDTVCLKGYGDLIYVLKMGQPKDVEKMVREAIETGGPTGFILGTSDGIRDGTPRENLLAYFTAAKKYGTMK